MLLSAWGVAAKEKFICYENNYTGEYVAITKLKGILLIYVRDITVMSLEIFHNNLRHLKWKFVS